MIILIIIFGLILRLFVINQSLWLDEAIGAIVVRDLTIKETFISYLPIDNHPPLYYLLLKFWTDVFGYSELALRLPSVLFGIATIYVVYLITEDLLKNKKLGLMIALLLATSQFHIYYSQEARMYSMAAFFASVAFYSFVKLLENESLIKYWIIFSFSLTLMVYTDYMPLFILPVFFIIGIVKKRDRKWWLKLLFSFAPIIIFGFIWLPVLNSQLAGGKWLLNAVPTWKRVAGGADIKQLLLVWIKFSLGRISIPNKLIYYLVIVIVSLPFAALFLWSVKNIKKYFAVFLWLFVPIILSFLISFFIPIFIYFRFLYVIPAFYIITGLGVFEFKNRTFSNILFIIILLVNVGSWIYYITNSFQQREEWKQAVSYIESNTKPNEISLFSYPQPFAPFRWYSKKPEKSFGATDSIYADRSATKDKTTELIKGAEGIYYFEYLKDISDPNSVVLTSITNSGFAEKEQIGRFNGIGYIDYFIK